MNYLISKEQYLSAKAAWNTIANRSPSDHIIYNVLRGFDSKRGFTEITNSSKLGNGASPWAGYETAKENAKWRFRPLSSHHSEQVYKDRMAALSKEWGFEFTPELMEAMREVLK